MFFLMTMNSTHLENSKNLKSDNQLILLKAYKRKTARQEKCSLLRPLKELKGFQKVELQPGEEKEITFTIKPEDLQFFDDSKHQWVVEPGKFKAYVSSSSADVRNTVEFEYL